MEHPLRRALASFLPAALLVVPLIVSASAPASAVKSTGNVIIVDADGTGSAKGCNGSKPVPTTIQAGVDAAAPGDTVKVCPGSYNESVDINKPLTLQGSHAGLDQSACKPQINATVVDGTTDQGALKANANNVTIDGFIVEDNAAGPGIYLTGNHSGYNVVNNQVDNNIFGIYANSDGTFSSSIKGNCITNNNQAGAATGNGIYADQGTSKMTISGNGIQSEDNTGIFLFYVPAGPENLNVQVLGNTLTNMPATFIAVFDSHQVRIQGNTMTNPGPPDPTCASCNSGVFVGGPSDQISVWNNTITNAQYSGIAVRDQDGYGNNQPGATTNVSLNKNKITSAGNNGIDVTAAGLGAVTTEGNTVKNNGLAACDPGVDPGCGTDGIHYGPLTHGNLIDSNKVLGSLTFDCRDLSSGSGTSGTANTWSNNTGVTSSPPGLCTKGHG